MDSGVWRSVEHSRCERKLYKPASYGKKEQSTQGQATNWRVSWWRRSETASGWRESHPTARQRAYVERAISRWHRERIESILVLTSDRAFSGGVKHSASVWRQSDGGTVWCGLSEVLGSSGVWVMYQKNWNYKNRRICWEKFLKFFWCSAFIVDLIVLSVVK
jgi:hypothetical protein